MAGTPSTIAVTPGSGVNVATVTDGSGTRHPAGVLEYSAADGTPLLVSVASPLPVSDAGGSLTVDGAVSVSNFPNSQAVTGTVAIGGVANVRPASPSATDYLPVRLTDGTAFYAASGGGGGSGGAVTQSGAWIVGLTAGSAAIGSITNTSFGVSSLPALPAGSNAIGTVGVTSSVLPSGAATESGNLATIAGKDFATQATLAALNAKVTACNTGAVVLAAGAATIGSIANTSFAVTGTFWQSTQPVSASALPLPAGAATSAAQGTGNTSLSSIDAKTPALSGGSVPVAAQAGAAGGWTPSHLLTAATTNATSVKAAAGQVGGWCFSNTNASTRYVKFFDKASAPSLGSDTPKFVVAVPGGTSAAPTVVTSNTAAGIAFALGIALAVTGGIADADATAVTAGDMSVDLLTK